MIESTDRAFIEKLTYECGNDIRGASVLLVGVMQRPDEARDGWPSDAASQFRVTLHFDGVRDLELKGFGQFPTQIMGFDIVDVSDRGWDGISFSVEDYENGALQFNCRDIEILDVTRI